MSGGPGISVSISVAGPGRLSDVDVTETLGRLVGEEVAQLDPSRAMWILGLAIHRAAELAGNASMGDADAELLRAARAFLLEE